MSEVLVELIADTNVVTITAVSTAYVLGIGIAGAVVSGATQD